ASVCLLQYFLHAYRLAGSRKQTEQFREELAGLEDELTTVQKDRTITRLENHILREFVAETECDKALGLVLRRFVTNPKDGFSAFLQYREPAFKVKQSRGLSDASADAMKVDLPLLDRLHEGKAIALEGNALAESQILASLSSVDRQKARQLFLLGVTSG